VCNYRNCQACLSQISLQWVKFFTYSKSLDVGNCFYKIEGDQPQKEDNHVCEEMDALIVRKKMIFPGKIAIDFSVLC
jgi:hypothetical protein